MKTEPVTAGEDAMRLILNSEPVCAYKYIQKPDIYRCICSIRDRIGFSANSVGRTPRT